MTINCTTFEEFMDCIYAAVTKGLMFHSDAHKLTITFTGGY